MARIFENIDNDPDERARLRAEFAHILSTFPLVAEPVKIAALNAWRDVQTGLIQ